jgi:hypothetical protein
VRAQVTITIYGTTSELTVFTSGSASVWARIYSALTAAGISYVPGSLYINGVPMPKESDSVIIGVPIGVSLGVLFLASIVAVRCFQKRKPGAHTPHLRPQGRRWSRLPHADPLPSSSTWRRAR